MKTDFVIYCDASLHDNINSVIRLFAVSSSPDSDQIGVHPLGRNSTGDPVPVLLIDQKPILREISNETLEKLVNKGQTSITHNFKCPCGKLNVEVKNERLIKIIQESFISGVSRISLKDLNDKVSNRQI